MLLRSSTRSRASFEFPIQDLNQRRREIKMNELPNELICMIFNHLDLIDLIDNCRFVSKRWLALVDSIKFKELVFTDLRQYGFDYTWYHTFKPINPNNLMYLHWASNYNANYPTIKYNKFSHLKRLKINFLCSYLDFDQLNKFIQLEHLELSRFNVESTEESILCLPNLRVLYLDNNSVYLLLIDAAKLEALKCEKLSRINLIHPESIKFLELYEIVEDLNGFRNLEVCKMKITSKLEHDMSLLSKLPSCLKEFHFDFELGFYGLHSRMQTDYFKFILEDKLKKRRSDLKIFIDAIESKNGLDLNQFNLKKLDLYHFYYKQLTILPRFTSINYDKLMKLFNNSIPNDFFIKFNNIQQVFVNKRVNQDEFSWFLKGCHHLSKLQIDGANLNQEFYDELPKIASLLFELILISNLGDSKFVQIDFKFISEFKRFAYLYTTHYISSESAKYLIKNTKFLKKLDFNINNDLGVRVNKTPRTYKSIIEIWGTDRNTKFKVNNNDDLDKFFASLTKKFKIN